MSSTRTSPPTGSNRTGPLSFQTDTIRRMHLHNMRTILSKLTTNFFLHKFSRLLLQKMFANCCHTKTRHDLRWMRLTKHSLRSTELNRTSANRRQSTCMRSRISRPRRLRPQTPMWRHSGHNAHHNSNSVNNKVETEEIVQEAKTATGAITTTTDLLKTRATTLPETVNSASTARFLITHRKSAAKELMTKNPV